LSYRNSSAFNRPSSVANHDRKDSKAPATLIRSYKLAYFNANKQEAPFVKYTCGRFYVAGTTGTGMTLDQFSSLIVRLQSRASRSSTGEERILAD
jgi:hypothetical protein